ncbi:MAG: hypothetical protein Q8L45_10555 [Xanthomonadaceae bacterium]|nr:hypothetical protein [Xanthomonadaceae bacterium]MDZ4117435.1 hypothetical protein [Xanthomonadaceae bacterium]MDZ4377704.1 hypothetical protein [Xanthomonadaceae bacterium]
MEEDTANAASKRYSTRAFDHENRETFASYHGASATSVASVSQGTRTNYVALGDACFAEQVASTLGRCFTAGKAGRPRQSEGVIEPPASRWTTPPVQGARCRARAI